MLVIVDYGVGNLASMKNMYKKIGIEAKVSSDEKDIQNATKLILPGVGAFDTCAARLQQSGFINILNKKVIEEKTPVLGVCVGMQLLTEASDEGELAGLGWIKGRVVKFKQEEMNGLKIPHMGWTAVKLNKPSLLFEEMYEEPRFYFVHSYYPELVNKKDVLVTANYGYDFTAGIEHENIMGVQFHPEKSHKFGMKLLENFVKDF